MSDKRIRAQGVIYTTLVDFLLQIVFLLVLLLVPLISYLNKRAEDIEALNRIQPHVKVFLPKTESINWQDLELALVPKDIAKAYAAEPEKLGADLKEIMANVGMNPKVASLDELKKRMANYKELQEKADKYDRLQGKPKCSLALEGTPYVAESQPLLDVAMQSGGFRIKPSDDVAYTYLEKRAHVQLGRDFVFKARSEYLALMTQVARVDPSCNHTVRLVADDTPLDAKEEYKALLQVIDQTSYKQLRIPRRAAP